MKRAHVLISGSVQGVFFRYEASDRAKEYGVTGWVRNLPDGMVEAVFEGAQDAVESMIGWCHQGPPMAQVESVKVDWQEPIGDRSFRIR